VAFLVDRGPLGMLLLLFAGAAAALLALKRVRSGDADVALGAAAMLGTLSAALVAGLFDAVLLLPAPAFFTAATVGALLPVAPAVVSRPLGGRERMAGWLVGAVVAAVLVAHSAGQLRAILLTRDDTSRAVVERALRYDPGNYRLHLLLARRGSCATRVRHARAAAALMPYHPFPRQAASACGVRLLRR
jgi:hypothetical protein